MVALGFPPAVTVSVAGLAWVMVFAAPSHAQGPTSAQVEQQEDVAAPANGAVPPAERQLRQAKPSKPRGFEALPGAGKVKLGWLKPSRGGKVEYEERHRLKSKSKWSKAKSTSSRSMSFKGLKKGKYQFQVRARNATGTGKWAKLTTQSYVATLPIVSIVTDKRKPIVSKDDYLDASMKIKPNGTKVKSFKGDLKIRGRGNSTWGKPKKPYKLKLAEKSKLMGMPKSKHWALLANYFDPSQLRNSAAMFLGEQTTLAWTPKMRHVEVQVNGEYMGLYQLAETVRIEDNRVDITEMSPSDTGPVDITGGYLIEQDGYRELNQEFGFLSSLGIDIVVKSPEPDAEDGISEADLAPQLDYISNYVDAFEASLPSGYAEFIDARSFIDWFFVEELVRDADAVFSSDFLYKPRSGLLFAGPLWDFDRAIGQRKEERSTVGWKLREQSLWYSSLFTDPTFASQTRQAWAEEVPGFRGVEAFLTETNAEIKKARKSNTQRWPETKPKEIDKLKFLTQWLNERTEWMGSNL